MIFHKLSSRARKPSFINLLHDPAYAGSVTPRLDCWLCQVLLLELIRTPRFDLRSNPFFSTESTSYYGYIGLFSFIKLSKNSILNIICH